MGESLRLVAISVGFVALLAALGSGPLVAWGGGLRARAALAPVLGLAMAASLLTTAGLVVSTSTSAPLLLAPACLASAAWALWRSRRRLRLDRTELAVPAAIAAAGLLIAILPGLLRETVGPVSLAHFDVWAYLPASHWLQEHSIADALPAFAARYDLTLGTGYGLTECGCRLGVTEVQAGVALLFGTGADDTSLPFLAALFAMLPLSVWFCARNLGAGRGGAAFGALFGLSPTLLLFVADSTLGTLAGLAVAPALVVLAFRRPDDLRAGPILLAGLLLGGLIALYPEYLLSFLAVCALGALAAALARRRRGRLSSDWAWESAKPLLGVGIVAALTSPVALQRAIEYFGTVSEIQIELPRYLSAESFGSWAFGVLNLYELQRFGELSALETAIAVALPLALALLVAAGLAGGGGRRAFFVLGPIAVSALLGVYVYYRYGDKRCEYCLFKALTFALPFLAVGLGLGMGTLLARARGRGSRLALGGLALLAVAALARADAQMVRALDRSAAAMTADQRTLTAAVDRLGPRAPLLLEGMDATSVPLWDLPQAYYLARQAEGSRISFDARGVAPTALFRTLPARRYYSPDYRYVVTTFPGISGGRALISRHGSYALMRRAPIDVAITRPGWALDPSQGPRAIPWLQGPFELWISSPRSGPAALRYRLFESPSMPTVLRFGGSPVRGNEIAGCVPLRLRPGLNRVRVRPQFPGSAGRLYPADPVTGVAFATAALEESIRDSVADPIPPPPRLAGLAGLEVVAGGCR